MARFASLVAAAALVSSAAAAQYYPQYPQPYPSQPYGQPVPTYPYPGQPYPGQPYGNDQSAVGAIIDGLIGNRYNVSDRQAIRQCAFAAVQRSQGYSGYGGYNNFARVTAITDVERRTFGVRVRGLLATGRSGYNGGYGRGDLGFRCDVDYRGYVRNVRLDPLVRRY
jgi:opacity protein-like surface antigen